MRKKMIEKNLKKALLDDGPFVWALYEYNLEEHPEEYLLSKRTDGDKFFFRYNGTYERCSYATDC
jgi:hypothetical protein